MNSSGSFMKKQNKMSLIFHFHVSLHRCILLFIYIFMFLILFEEKIVFFK